MRRPHHGRTRVGNGGHASFTDQSHVLALDGGCQHFAFVGYLPQEATARAQRVRELEALAHKTGQTQMFIETPYRNEGLMNTLIAILQPRTRLAICCGITLSTGRVFSAAVADWKRQPPAWPMDLPTVFLLGR